MSMSSTIWLDFFRVPLETLWKIQRRITQSYLLVA